MRFRLDPGLEQPSFEPPGALALGKDGRWTHDGDPVRHARLSALLDRSVARDEAGHLMVTTGRDRLPFTSEDAPLRIKTARVHDDGLVQVHRDGREEPLTEASALCIDDEGRLRSRVSGPRGGIFWALWERPAVQALAPLLQDDGSAYVEVSSGRLDIAVVEASQDWTT